MSNDIIWRAYLVFLDINVDEQPGSPGCLQQVLLRKAPYETQTEQKFGVRDAISVIVCEKAIVVPYQLSKIRIVLEGLWSEPKPNPIRCRNRETAWCSDRNIASCAGCTVELGFDVQPVFDETGLRCPLVLHDFGFQTHLKHN